MWAPMLSEVVVNVATPPTLIDWVPIREAPSKNDTVPVGVPAPVVTVTLAVNVTDWPNAEGLLEEERAVLVSPWLTNCDRAGDVAVV